MRTHNADGIRADPPWRFGRALTLHNAGRNRLFLLRRQGSLGGFFRALLFCFFGSLAGGLFLFGPALPFLKSALALLLAEPRLFNLALTLFDVFPLAGLEKGARPRVHLPRRKLPKHFLRALISAALFGAGLLKRAMLGLLRRGFLRLQLLGKAAGETARLRFVSTRTDFERP